MHSSIKFFGIRSSAMVLASVVLLWTVCWVSIASCAADVDSDLIETENGWQFDDDQIDPFDAPAPAPAAAAPPSGNQVPLINGNFEACNITGNSSVNSYDNTTTLIINWSVGGAGVQVINGNTYQMSPRSRSSVFAVHLNNPTSSGGSTQGAIMTNLAVNPPTGKSFTVQFDSARNPDGPLNLYPALKISTVEGGTTKEWNLREPIYNITDTQRQITWQAQSFLYTGTGVATTLKIESMTEKYGCIVDNVIILNGKHPLSAASPTKLALWQRMFPIFTVCVLVALSYPLSLSAL